MPEEGHFVMPEFVRVTDPDTGAHVTVTAQRAQALGLKPHKSAAVDRYGNPLPAKPRVDLRAPRPEHTEDAPEVSDTTTKEK